jgi:hypothetical protein
MFYTASTVTGTLNNLMTKASNKMTYADTFNAVKDNMQKTLERKGLYVENDSNTGGLSVSLTQFNLSGVYATITTDEINYYIESLDEDELNEIVKEQTDDL